MVQLAGYNRYGECGGGGGLDAPAMPRVDLSNPVITHPVKLSTTAPTETSISALNDIYTPIGTPHHDVCIGLKPFNRTWRYLGAGARRTVDTAPRPCTGARGGRGAWTAFWGASKRRVGLIGRSITYDAARK